MRETIQTAEFYEAMENVEVKCDAEYEGSNLYKWICVLVYS